MFQRHYFGPVLVILLLVMSPLAHSEEATEAVPQPKKLHHKRKHKVKGSRNPASVPTGASEPTRPSAVRLFHEDSPVEKSPQEEHSRITGNWGGARDRLSALGVDIALIYKASFTKVIEGGIDRTGTYLGNIDLRIGLDAEKLVGWKGGSAFVYLLNNHGGFPSVKTGDMQTNNNIESPTSMTQLYEAWVQQLMFDDKFSVLVGLHDLNSEFYANEASAMFFNSSFGIGMELSQTGGSGPSIFPHTGTAVRLRAEPTKSFYVQSAVFNSRAGTATDTIGNRFDFNLDNGMLWISEVAYVRGKSNEADLYGKYAIGAWTYSRSLTGMGRGLYFISEQNFSHLFAAFIRYGVASSDLNRVKNNLAVGVKFTGLIPKREKDLFGLGVTRAANGDQYISDEAVKGHTVVDAETAVEGNYRVELSPGIAVQPSFQYIINPNTESGPHALIGEARVELSF